MSSRTLESTRTKLSILPAGQVQDLVGRQTLGGYTASISKPPFHQVFEAHGRTDQCPALKFLEDDLGGPAAGVLRVTRKLAAPHASQPGWSDD